MPIERDNRISIISKFLEGLEALNTPHNTSIIEGRLGVECCDTLKY